MVLVLIAYIDQNGNALIDANGEALVFGQLELASVSLMGQQCQ